MRRLARDATAEPVSRDQIFRRERGQRNIFFPVQLSTSRIGSFTRLILILDICVTIHTYIQREQDQISIIALPDAYTCLGATQVLVRLASVQYFLRLAYKADWCYFAGSTFSCTIRIKLSSQARRLSLVLAYLAASTSFLP